MDLVLWPCPDYWQICFLIVEEGGSKRRGPLSGETDHGRSLPGAARNERRWAMFSWLPYLATFYSEDFPGNTHGHQAGSKKEETCFILWFILGDFNKERMTKWESPQEYWRMESLPKCHLLLFIFTFTLCKTNLTLTWSFLSQTWPN